MHIPLCMAEDIEVYLLAHILSVQRTVRIRHNKTAVIHSFRIPVIRREKKTAVILFFQLRHSPKLEKHHGKAVYGIAFQHHGRILPVTEPLPFVDIFVGQVHPSGKCGMAVDNAYLSMIPVVLIAGKSRFHRRKHFTLNPLCLKRFRVGIGKQRQRAHTVIHKSDLQPLFCFLLEDFQYCIPHNSAFHNKIFHENEMLGLS